MTRDMLMQVVSFAPDALAFGYVHLDFTWRDVGDIVMKIYIKVGRALLLHVLLEQGWSHVLHQHGPVLQLLC